MRTPTDVIEYKGYTFKVYQDENPEDPREWDNLGLMVCFHRRYSLPNELDMKEPEDLAEWEKDNVKDILFRRPLFMYDHSVQYMSTRSFIGRAQHAEWDSGQVGFIYALKSRVRTNWNVKRVTRRCRDLASMYIDNEVDDYSNYISGNVYWFELTSPDGTEENYGSYYGWENTKIAIDTWKVIIDRRTMEVKHES